MKRCSSYVTYAIRLLSFRLGMPITTMFIGAGETTTKFSGAQISMNFISYSNNCFSKDLNIVSKQLSPSFEPFIPYNSQRNNETFVFKTNASSGTLDQCPVSLPLSKQQDQRKPSFSEIGYLNLSPIFSFLNLGFLFMMLLAIQFAVQPILTKSYIPRDKAISRSSIVLATDIVKFVVAMLLWYLTNPWEISSTLEIILNDQKDTELFQEATMVLTNLLVDTIKIAGIPAALSLLQNHWNLIASQHLQPITFNALNQTKTVFAALSCYLVLNQCQSQFQIMSLILLIVASMIMESIIPLPSLQLMRWLTRNESHSTKIRFDKTVKMDEVKNQSTMYGVVAVLAASMVSGLSGAFTQKSLQAFDSGLAIPLNPLIYSAQISFVSIVLSIFMIISSGDWKQLRNVADFTAGWTVYTWIPVFTNAIGGKLPQQIFPINKLFLCLTNNRNHAIPTGILVGLVVQHAGVIRKGFACIIGLFLSGIIQNIKSKYDSRISYNKHEKENHGVDYARINASNISSVTPQQWIGGLLATLSLFIHATFPYKVASS